MSEEQAIASAVVPYLDGESQKNEYLHIRACGFGIRESLALVGRSHRTLRRWRDDLEFADLELRLPELRKELSGNFLQMQFTRNLVLALRLDERLFRKTLDGEVLTRVDSAYLNKARSTYTPQALEALTKSIMLGKAGDGDWVTLIRRYAVEDRMELRKRGKDGPVLDQVIEGEFKEEGQE